MTAILTGPWQTIWIESLGFVGVHPPSWISRGKIRGLGAEFDLDQSGVTGRSNRKDWFHVKSHMPADLGFLRKWVGLLGPYFLQFAIGFILLPSNRSYILTRNKQMGVKWRKDIISGHCVTNTIEQLPSTLRLDRRPSSLALRFFLPVGLKLYKDKDKLNLQDISLWSQGKGEISISRRLLR